MYLLRLFVVVYLLHISVSWLGYFREVDLSINVHFLMSLLRVWKLGNAQSPGEETILPELSLSLSLITLLSHLSLLILHLSVSLHSFNATCFIVFDNVLGINHFTH